ncbi:hypothetical protein [Pseudoalteromonas sp. DY56-GL79]|uniref:hypothetical protein n=1 Tax=Pseudoalteromonas sp. DY56-GL79 TaxID=2967131 RepID=UPI00352B99AF
MVKLIIFVFTVFAPIALSQPTINNALPFPDKKQRTEITTQLFSGIESIDAITITLRNKTRRIDWKTYKATASKRIINSNNWDTLYRALDNLHYGILNRHSYLIVDEKARKKVTNFPKWPKLEIGYTWPQISFFSTKNQKSIRFINGRSIEDLFEEFFNFYCNDVHKSGCLRLFSSYMKSGYFFAGGLDKLVVSYTDNSSDVFVKQGQQKNKQQASSECSEMYLPLGLNLLYDGSQSCLYESNGAFVLKIFYFGKWGSHSNDIYCDEAKEPGMCFDINEIKQITHSSPAKPLIVDIQNNKGGSENTPWIAALTRNGFRDNLVQYRNTPLLANKEIRDSAFYQSKRAERWYQNIVADITSRDDFLPPRPDFCRGSAQCDIRMIDSSSTPIKYESLKLVVNAGCVSSCDDFIWRTRQYANAKTFGQLPATDGAYARLTGYLFIAKTGKIINIITGEGEHPTGDNGTLLLTYQLPISKTVSFDGEMLEGNASVLDNLLPVSKLNYVNLELDNLVNALRD